jgi:hypothetical protein
MWPFAKKRKLASQIRFQQQAFVRELRQAQQYKRHADPLPEAGLRWWLRRLGLGGWIARGVTVLIIAAFIYILYVPNFLWITNITITGAEGQAGEQITGTIKDYFNKRSYFPQANFLALNTDRLGMYVKDHNSDIYRVLKVDKQFPRTVAVTVVLRQDFFVIERLSERIIVSNDGTIARVEHHDQAVPTAEQNINLLRIQLPESWVPVDEVFAERSLNSLTVLKEQFTTITGLQLRKVEFLSAPQKLEEPRKVILHVTDTSKNPHSYEIFVDIPSDIASAMARLKIALEQLGPATASQLAYIDMRFGNRGFACLVNTPCAQTAPQVSGDTIEQDSK